MDGEPALSTQGQFDDAESGTATSNEAATTAQSASHRVPSAGRAPGSTTEGDVAPQIDQTPRALRWARERSGHVPGWLLPVGVIVVTGWLGQNTNAIVVSYWLGIVTAVVAYAFALFALEPAPYARRLAASIAVAVGLIATQLLLDHVGHGLL